MISYILVFMAGYVVATLIYALLIIKHKFDGTINMVKTPEGKLFTLELERDPDTLKDRDMIIFRVKASE